MDWTIWEFITVIVIAFAVVAIAAGIFSAYFGKGKNKAYGIILTLAGLIIGFAWLYMIAWSDVEPFCDVAAWDVFYDALVNLIGILIGALIAVGIFLVALLKS
ncbi:hypothetical protein AUQ37_01845 [Candidatus Methanomethylophilus sp. 1R26]|jgi:membrane protease YdiL (CAAX protease family)|uniref:hypothetical protein n=1 Tax=Candidatus Methanomethylophilus sp. 1R26 TaxID=1769296 RepID=UPI000737AC4A|nr:hypothetical protein [Candidatus Methanomethylophilus sp. 1R26]MCH3978394.1 hypothetical protein [Methanomethylophilus sp.]TQS80846.1 MAG: hypothetical protein A3Q59_05985 [Methanomethylophilus alvi]WII08581.1 hypothetical protein O8W32_05255 [Methanomassiliicoccales archaeon LGM-DZ1]KUE73409.1 hypothetical protein AUQ37_01845 [Candidatus Methanomethylophilus sp. 1R26]MCI2074805.1 hypothetical protein [Methanomethylophilus sp.]